MFSFISVHIFKQKQAADVEMRSDVIHYMMFWRVPNKMEQRKELIGFYVSLETILSNFPRNWQEFYSELGVADCKVTQPWRQRTVDTWKKTLVITPALTKPGQCPV